MNAALGQSGVLLGFAACVFGAITLAAGLRSGRAARLYAGRPYVWLVLLGAVVAVLAMERALLTHDFSLQYVADNHSRSTPTLYTVASLWGALEGSILLWSVVLSGYLAAMTVRFRGRGDDPVVAWATLVAFVVGAFFFALMLGPANPFRGVSGAIPADGPGPNPLLQNHPLMAFHPPVLYLGYVGFTVPFAFAIASLVTGRVGEDWLAETRRWALLAWGALSAGIVLGAWWSYEVLGWGGYWAWDPVENASLLPWLTGTAYLHSVMVQQRRGLLRVWNLSLLLATFSLTILGTFLTRSGVLDSVHAFSDSPIGPLLLGFFAVTVAVVLGLIAWRGDRLRSPGTITSPLSREGAFLLNNLLFAAFAFVVLLGTVFPLVAEAIANERLSVGRPYFDRMVLPLGMALLFLMAVAPALPWRKASGELLRDRLQWPALVAAVVMVGCVLFGLRGLSPLLAFGLGAFAACAALRRLVLGVRHVGWSAVVGASGGGMIVHLGVVIIAVAFAASGSYAVRREVRMDRGEEVRVAGHTISYLGVRPEQHRNRTSIVADVRVDGGKIRHPALSRFPRMSQAVGTPSVVTSTRDDVYLTLVSAPRNGVGSAVVSVIVSPLVMWLWVGGAVMVIGTALSMVGGRRRVQPPAGRDEEHDAESAEATPRSEQPVVEPVG
ncbi:MAG TPA: heme lyase CcmF/NrfE family subunit [Acidimicrobiales bacterium]|nr:heme lyase CcmF/NrfE family subunit [Acidimicrobiales bacterium]